MTEGLPIRHTGAGAFGMPKHAKRTWPYEEGMQPMFWEREEELSKQYVSTSIAREIAMEECIENVRHASDMSAQSSLSMVQRCLDAYDIRVKEIYNAHRKSIREIKDRYPDIR